MDEINILSRLKSSTGRARVQTQEKTLVESSVQQTKRVSSAQLTSRLPRRVNLDLHRAPYAESHLGSKKTLTRNPNYSFYEKYRPLMVGTPLEIIREHVTFRSQYYSAQFLAGLDQLLEGVTLSKSRLTELTSEVPHILARIAESESDLQAGEELCHVLAPISEFLAATLAGTSTRKMHESATLAALTLLPMNEGELPNTVDVAGKTLEQVVDLLTSLSVGETIRFAANEENWLDVSRQQDDSFLCASLSTADVFPLQDAALMVTSLSGDSSITDDSELKVSDYADDSDEYDYADDFSQLSATTSAKESAKSLDSIFGLIGEAAVTTSDPHFDAASSTVYVAINGQPYGWKVPETFPGGFAEFQRKLTKIMEISTGRAIAFLRKYGTHTYGGKAMEPVPANVTSKLNVHETIERGFYSEVAGTNGSIIGEVMGVYGTTASLTCSIKASYLLDHTSIAQGDLPDWLTEDCLEQIYEVAGTNLNGLTQLAYRNILEQHGHVVGNAVLVKGNGPTTVWWLQEKTLSTVVGKIDYVVDTSTIRASQLKGCMRGINESAFTDITTMQAFANYF